MRRSRDRAPWSVVGVAMFVATGLLLSALSPRVVIAQRTVGVREPAWSPDGKRIAVSLLDQIWVMTPDGKEAHPVTGRRPANPVSEREPAWSPDGLMIAFAANPGPGYDIYVVPSKGGEPEQVTALPGDERSPTWTNDGRLIFSNQRPQQWDLYLTTKVELGATVVAPPARITRTPQNEYDPRVSPDGKRVLFASDRDTDDGEPDLWMMPLSPFVKDVKADTPDSPDTQSDDSDRIELTRVVRARGREAHVSWAPAGDRIAYYAERDGIGGVWVAPVDPEKDADGNQPKARPANNPVLVSRHGGAPAWSPDGRSILIAELPEAEPEYNGNPKRSSEEQPPLFSLYDAFKLWTIPAPLPVDEGGKRLAIDVPVPSSLLLEAFDRTWRMLKTLYFSPVSNATQWDALRTKYRPQAEAARDENTLETVIDRMLGEQPLVKQAVTADRAIVVSGHRLASEAGAAVLEKGGNIVDAAIAVSFALGVVEPDASGIGGDGMALLFQKDMKEPTVIDFKDQTPIHATLDNQTLFKDGRLVTDGPAAANIPGVVAGMDYLYQRYASKKISWSELVAPAVKYAEEGFVLDPSLPTTIDEARPFLDKYSETRRVFVPGGRVPRPGERFRNPDYGRTLRSIARGGADAFYRGDIARRIAADMAENGGIIGFDDLAQYRAIERRPLLGHFRNHEIYTVPPPVPSGAALIEALQIFDRYTPKPKATVATDADYFHYLIESWKARDALRRVADPDRWTVEVDGHLNAKHADELFKRIDPLKAGKFREPPDEEEDGTRERIGRGTTGFVVADADGNVIAVTQTLSTWGGSFYVSGGLGFLYNNHLHASRTASGSTGQLLPLARSSSVSNPTLVFRDTAGVKTPRLAVSAAGNAWITASVLDIITSVLDGGLSAQRAVEAPRYLVGRDLVDPVGLGARVQIEDRIPRDIVQELEKRGHLFQKIGRKGELRYGYASAVVLDPQQRVLEGGADPRRANTAIGLSTRKNSQ